MLVEEVMTTEVETVDVKTSMADALDRMLEAKVGSLVVTKGKPQRKVGIVTDADVKRAFQDVEDPLQDASFYERLRFLLRGPGTGASIREYMTAPLVTIEPTETLSTAVARMNEYEVKHLVVTKHMELEGMLTPSDVARAHDDIVKEARRSVVRRPYWES